jgi:hypothetical protein
MTFSPPLNPITSEHILVLLRDEWFPFVVRNLKQKWSMNAFYRGVVEGGDDGCSAKPVEKAAAAPAARRGQPPASAPAARGTRTTGRGAATAKPEAAPPPPEITWAAPSHLLGLTANYMGARNRVGIAGVLHARDTAGERADAANRFLEEALGFAWAASVRIKKATEDAEKQLLVGRSLPTSARPMTIGQVEVLMSAPSPDGAAKRTASPVAVTMRDRLRFEPASDEVVAAEYFIPAGETAIVDLLRNHGIAVRQITQPTKGVEEFVEAKGAAGGPASPRLSGSWQASQAEVPAGSWVVRMNQPLARLAFALVEPTSDESVATFLRGDDGHPYAIMRRR